MQTDEIIIKIVCYLLGIIGSLLLFSCAIIVYVFNRHVQDNDRENEKNRDDHIRIFDRIEKIEIKKK
jgi:hypothetical protein